MSEEQSQGYLEIERRAFEHYVLDLARGFAAEEERLYREIRGEDLNVLVRSVELVREYPQTALRVQTYDRVRDLEQWSEYPIWDDDYVGGGGEMRSASYIAGEILRMVRGG